MSAPVSNGVLRTKLSDMKIGDYIKWGYTAFSANVAGTLQEDTAGMDELSSVTAASTGGGGYFYFIKWKQGLLVADRGIQSSISAQSLNKVGYYEGSKYRVLTEEEFNAVISDDFGGNFKFSASAQTTFVAANNIGKNYTDGTIDLYPIQLQNLKKQIYIGSLASQGRGTSYNSNNPTYTMSSFKEGHDQSWVIHNYTFLPCMEYVDSSKSTNIFY